MKIGVSVPNIGPVATPESVKIVAQKAEALGYNSLWTVERLLWPVRPQAAYPVTPDGSLPEPYKYNLDPLDTLTFAAACTSKIRLGPSVLDMPYYNPVTLARRLTTIDILSKGRLNVGLGQGWSPDELEATGADMKVRGARADDGIARDTPNLMPDHRVRVLAGGVGGITIAVKPRVDCAASIACPFRFSLRLGTSSAGAGKYSDLEGLRESADRVCVKSEARGKSGR